MRGKISRNINLAIFVTVLIGCGLWLSYFRNIQANPITEDGSRISFLDVGQGDATLISLPESFQILIDAGRDAMVLDRLNEKMPIFDRKIELVMLTHPDADHIGGFEKILESYQVEKVVKTAKESDSKLYQRIMQKLSEKQIKVENPEVGEKIDFGNGSNLEFMFPKKEDVENLNTNESSIISKFSSKDKSLMLLGDAEISSQNEVLKNFEKTKIDSDILKVSHHGAQSGLNGEFVEAVSPKYAIISVGKNSYGHPHQGVLNFFVGLGIKILRTDLEGTISL